MNTPTLFEDEPLWEECAHCEHLRGKHQAGEGRCFCGCPRFTPVDGADVAEALA